MQEEFKVEKFISKTISMKNQCSNANDDDMFVLV